MSVTTMQSGLERRVSRLAQSQPAPIMTTCYLDVDGHHRPRLADCLEAFGVLAQRAVTAAQSETPELQAAVERDVATMRDWLHRDLDRSRTRGVALVACSLSQMFEVISLPVPVHDEIVVSQRPHLFQVETILGEAETFGIALIDHERLRLLEYRLGELFEHPALFEGPPPHRDRQHGWSVTGSTAASGHDAAHWQPAGAHVDRHEVEVAEHHIAACAAALARHLEQHPVDHLLLGGPEPERARLERALTAPARAKVAGLVTVRVTAPLTEIHDAMLDAVRDVEDRDEAEVLAALDTALGTGRGVQGMEPVQAALAAGRVAELVLATAPDGEMIEAAVERAAATGATTHFIRYHQMPAETEGIAAITRY